MIKKLCIEYNTRNEFIIIQKQLLKNGCVWADGTREIKYYNIYDYSYITVRDNVIRYASFNGGIEDIEDIEEAIKSNKEEFKENFISFIKFKKIYFRKKMVI